MADAFRCLAGRLLAFRLLSSTSFGKILSGSEKSRVGWLKFIAGNSESCILCDVDNDNDKDVDMMSERW